jgi:glycosyltransferase involved in cell wall biosynthesis
MVMICLQLSISISGLQENIRKLAEQSAISKLELERSLLRPMSVQNIDEVRDPLILIPAFNEESSIAEVVTEIKNLGFDALVINDGSIDRTSFEATGAGALVLDLPVNLGVGGALRTGFAYAVKHGYTSVVQIDGDGQHPTEQIAALITAAQSFNADIVIGSRFRSETPTMEVGFIRRFVMQVLAKSASSAANTQITDSTSGFRIIRGQLLNEFSQNFPAYYLGDTYEVLVSAGRAGYRVLEIEASITPRLNGVSTASPLASAKWTVKTLVTVLLGNQTKIKSPKQPDSI